MMRSLKSTIFVIAMLLLSACSMIQEKHIDGQSISNSEGIVVTNLISNTDEARIQVRSAPLAKLGCFA